MNIDKTEMAYAWDNRSDPEQYNKLLGYFQEMVDYFANYYHISYALRDDFKQEGLITAFKAIEKFDPSKKSSPFSYFYKVISIAFLYWLRREKQKKDARPAVCSIEKLENTLTDDRSDIETQYEDKYIEIDGKTYEKDKLLAAVKEAKSLTRRYKLVLKRNKFYSEKTEEYISVEDDLVKMSLKTLLEKREKKG